MTSSSGTLQHSNESRFASGTAANGGTGTPRRVQWASHDGVRVNTHPQTSPRQTMHELDEMGTDPGAFETLRNALQRHQSGEQLLGESGPREGSTSVVPSVPPQALVTIRVTGTSAPASHYSPFTTPPVTSSRYPPTRMNSDNPYPTTQAPQNQVSGSQGSSSSSTQNSPTIDDTSTHHSPSTRVAQRTHDVPGEVWIDPLEREGLPFHTPMPNSRDRREFGDTLRRRSTMRSGSRDGDGSFGEKHLERMAERQAAGVVRAHTRRGWGRLHRSPNGNKDTKSRGTHNGEKDRGTDEKGKATMHTLRHTHSDTENDADFTDGEFHPPERMRKGVPGSWLATVKRPRTSLHDRQQDPEDHRGHPHSPKFGNGVLSALLALYGHDHDDEESVSGASTPGGRSRTSSDAGSVDDILPKPHRPWLPDQPEDDNRDHPTSKGQKAVKSKYFGKFSLGRSRKGGSTSSIIDYLRPPTLPTTSTTAALVAGAGTLSGVATPQQATLAPNLKRTGYNLVRYSVEDGPETRCEETDSEAELPDTPGATIVVSPTTGSEGLVHRPREGPEGTPGGRKGWTGRLKDLPLPMHISPSHLTPFPSPHTEGGLHTPGESATATPKTASAGGTPMDEFDEKKDYFDLKHVERETQRIEERQRKEQKERQRRRGKEIRRKRKKAEVYITRHVAEILQRQEFIMKLARAMMMFGGPSHRLAAQIQSTARVLDLELSCMYLPDVMLISFEDRSTGTSNVKFIRQGSALDLEKLGDTHLLYWEVIHDTMSVSGASALLDVLMRKKPLYNFAQLTIIGGMCSASICSVSFSGSFIDSLASAPLGALLVGIQLIGVRNELYVNVFEITIATLLSFLSAALASTTHFCYSAVASSSVVLILPGFIVLSGSLELSSRSLVAGAVRLCFALMYSLFLGFGLAIGAQLYQTMLGQSVIGPTDYACMDSHDPTGPWWQQTPSLWWAFLTVPMYSLFLSMRLMAPLWRKEMILLIAIASIGWVTNHFVGTKFPNQSDISAAVGAFAVGFVSNIYGRFFNGNAFVVMITGILFQVPSGLGNGGLLNFVSDQTSGSSSTYLSGFQTALQLISVSIGLTVGLGISLVVVHPVLSRRRAGGLFSL